MPAPRVSVVIPCRNEARHIRGVLDALRAQDFGDFEVIVVDGQSDDGTPAMVQNYAGAHADLLVRLLDNPDRTIPAALNQGIRAAAGEIVVRLDGHALPAPDYLTHCLRALDESGAGVVGGRWEISPGGPGVVAQGIALALSTPLGAGDAYYRLSDGSAGNADTVPFGCFRRDLWAQLGGYDEHLHTNEDYEFNLRVRRAGRQIWFDPSIRSIYFARSSYRALAKQYWRYGWWKAQMTKRYFLALRWRQVLPPVWVAGSLGLLAAGVVAPNTAPFALAAWLAYLLVLFVEACRRARGLPVLALATAGAYVVVHYAWGLGFVAGLGANTSRSAKWI